MNPEDILMWDEYRDKALREERARTTPWLQTRSGRAFPLLDPQPSDVHWPDIVYALAHTNRFGGHVGPYSVAQHSVLVAKQLRPEWRAYGLLHDAHEAFIGDIPTPLKRLVDRYTSALWCMSEDIDAAIFRAAGLLFPWPEEIAEAVKIADIRVLVTERRDLMREPPHSWGTEYDNVEPLPERIEIWPAEKAIARFALMLSTEINLTLSPASSI